ncbi:glycosyltransferase family 39 protein [Paraburkholderia acidiphila]|uniref:Glycosyltransferase RgtA/B/C/D-like domain-containing protein n=1 Tax=Paraburkholderia acidiphila TaxID=2571747 RepID=A0A7Z2G2F1_9BURK|nr:glycosyltransferase family 39 protein [Paraburkholderia acidiphila]QGZ53988.1 hypothetical protein FAZ97_03130 [Paraburkholderia acidiphila]
MRHDPDQPNALNESSSRSAGGSVPKLFLAVALVSIIFLLMRNAGLYPTVFADELHYNLLSRIQPLASASEPAYLYLGLFRATNFCGEGFLQCVRILNVVVYAIGVAFVFLTARRFTSTNVAAFIGIVVLLMPTDVYTAYFMPEAMYFCGFWIVSWFVLTGDDQVPMRYAVGVGVLLALLALIKPHALFLVPALFVFVAYRASCSDADGRLARSLMAAFAFLAVAICVRSILGYLVAGHDGLSPLGSRYNDQASESGAWSHLSTFGVDFLGVLGRHLIALCVMFGVPIAISLDRLRRLRLNSRPSGSDRISLAIYLSLVLATLTVVTSLFTVIAAGGAPYEVLGRLHMRYYNFTFPLFLILAGASLRTAELRDTQSARRWRVGRWAIAALVVICAIAGIRHGAALSSALVDNPEFRAFTRYTAVFIVVSLCGLLSLAVWAYDDSRGAKLFMFLFVPLYLVVALYGGTHEMRERLTPDAYDEAGMFARRFLSDSDRGKLLVVGSDLGNLYKTLFYVDNTSARLITLGENAPLQKQAIPNDSEWVLIIGNHAPVASDNAMQGPNGMYTLLHMAGNKAK